MKEVLGNWTAIVAGIGVIAFVLFALPFTPPWLSWPALGIAIIALGRLIVVGDRKHWEVKDTLDLDRDHDAPDRMRRIIDLLGRDRRP